MGRTEKKVELQINEEISLENKDLKTMCEQWETDKLSINEELLEVNEELFEVKKARDSEQRKNESVKGYLGVLKDKFKFQIKEAVAVANGKIEKLEEKNENLRILLEEQAKSNELKETNEISEKIEETSSIFTEKQ